MRGFVLTTERQVAMAGAAAVLALWLGVSTAATLVALFTPSSSAQAVARTEAKYERWIADRDARLDSAVAQLDTSGGAFSDIANSVEKRNQALVMLLTDLRGAPGTNHALTPILAAAPSHGTPMQRIQSVQADQDRLIDAAETFAKNRADRLRLVFRLAGLDPDVYAASGGEGLGGPLIEAKDPRALAAVLDVDEDFAGRIQHAVADLTDMRNLSDAAADLPLARPTVDTRETSGFGVRIDPFTQRPAFHPGQDFAGAYGSPIYVTAPGVVSFTGVRNGYGNTIEVDHGHGFKTRYAHLSAISVSVGQHVAIGQRIGAMGSTGRSTGSHLHYEVWQDGKVENPLRFVKAGDYVQQTDF
jgi:murein DD-endopeptidase MepM/ murein hydrolase activator NlpD